MKIEKVLSIIEEVYGENVSLILDILAPCGIQSLSEKHPEITFNNLPELYEWAERQEV